MIILEKVHIFLAMGKIVRLSTNYKMVRNFTRITSKMPMEMIYRFENIEIKL